MRVARADRVGGDVDLDAAVEQVEHGLRDAHVRLDAADERLVAAREVEASARTAREDRLLDRAARRGSPTSGAVWPRPFGYCSVTSDRHAEDRARPATQLAARRGDVGEGVVGAEALLDVDDDQRGAVAVASSAHQAVTTHREWRARGRRRRRRRRSAARVPRSVRPAKQQFSERLSQPRSPTTHSASRSTSVRFAGSPGAIARRRQAEQRGAGGHPLDEQRRASSTPGSDQLGVERGERRLQPGRAHRRLLERAPPSRRARAARGRWRCSRSCPSRRPVDQRLAVGLGAQRRVHLHARVERRGRPRR